MENVAVGGALLDLCETARSELFLAAPFIKAKVLERILEVVDDSVTVTVVTRWRADEIHAGVSDLEVWEILNRRPGSTLLLLPELHAKYYRADGQSLLGSANLTQRALGWVSPSNVELLVEYDPQFPDLSRFEEMLRGNGREVDDSVVKEMKELVQSLPPMPSLEIVGWKGEAPPPVSDEDSPQLWLPSLRQPGSLYKAYCGDSEALTAVSREAAEDDLRRLRIPIGLQGSVFHVAVAGALLQKPIVRRLDSLLTTPQRFGAVTRWLRSVPGYGDDADAARDWQTLMRWLLFFLPKRYGLSVPKYSEVFCRKR